MPNKPKVHGARAPRQRAPDTRQGSTARGYGARWQKVRLHWLQAHPLCVVCDRDGRTEAATVVDHITPHRGDMDLFWQNSNWQSLCESCHNRKTAREDGGFGHAQ